MKKITLFLFLLISFSGTEAQKVYFVYLQSESQEPFYARLGEKIYNSSSSGYLILSKLVDSTYKMNIGVQGSQSPEQLFSVTINKKDKGYVIKNFAEKGWGLFDLQTFAVEMPASNNSVNFVRTEKRESNDFTDLLAKASDDSTIKEKPVFAKAVEKKIDLNVPPAEKKEILQNQKLDSANLKMAEIKPADLTSLNKEEIKEKAKDSILAKTEEKKADKPIQLVEKKAETLKPNIDSASLKTAEIKQPEILVEKKKEEIEKAGSEKKDDEIKPVVEKKVEEKIADPIVVPQEKKSSRNPFVNEFQKSIVIKRSESSTTEGFGIVFLDVTGDGSIDTIRILIPNENKSPVVTEPKKEELKFLNITSADTSTVQKNEEQKETAGPRTNSCSQQATDDDFFRLRKNMATETSNENMINEAKKGFRNRCFSTAQLKNLSTLFLTDEGKYKFFDASYTHVSDLDNFATLQTELKEEYYINRFKSMLY